MLVVSLDDLGDQLMADDVAVVEVLDGDIIDALQDVAGLFEAAGLAAGQVDLGDVAGDDCLGTEADTGEEHFHLLRCSVLRLIEDDEGIVQGTAAHVGQRSDFDVAALQVTVVGFGAEHIKEGIIEGAQIGVDLILQVTGQEAQLFARFNGRTGQDDAVDLLAAESGNGAGNSQVGLTCTGRADTDGDDIALNSVDIGLLTQGLGLDRLTADGDADDALAHLIQLVLLALTDQRNDVIYILYRDLLASCSQSEQGFDGLLGIHDIFGIAGNAQLGITVDDMDIVFLFQQLDVFIKGAEKIDDLFDAFDIDNLFDHLVFS